MYKTALLINSSQKQVSDHSLWKDGIRRSLEASRAKIKNTMIMKLLLDSTESTGYDHS